MNGGSIKQAIGEMRSMLNTPIKYVQSATVPTTPPASPSTPDPEGHKIAEGDLPSQFIRLMGKGSHGGFTFQGLNLAAFISKLSRSEM